MMDGGYSQLPVTKNGRITGVFTWRCFGKRPADLRRSSIKAIPRLKLNKAVTALQPSIGL
jgi:hypothetical protein